MSCTGFFFVSKWLKFAKRKKDLPIYYNEYVAINTLVCILGCKYKIIMESIKLYTIYQCLAGIRNR
jgi:hypothetical protein